MSTTRHGKIARLPRLIREEVNSRLLDKHQPKTIVAWLNALPEVRAVLAADFAGQPLREPNISARLQSHRATCRRLPSAQTAPTGYA